MKYFIRPRPIRIAYLVEESEQSRSVLDAIFAASFGQWGGRFSLIVPCANGAIRPAYIPWLRVYDADIIYSYVDLDAAAVGQLHHHFGPAFLVRHAFRGDKHDRRTCHPQLPIAPLSVLSVMATTTRGNMFSPPQPVALVDTHLAAQPSFFLQHNFGCYGQSLSRWPIAGDLRQFLSPVIFVPEEIQANPRLVPRAEGDIVSSERTHPQDRDPAEFDRTGAVIGELRATARNRRPALVKYRELRRGKFIQ